MSNTRKQHGEEVDQDKDQQVKVQTLDYSKETGISRKSNNKRNFKLEYQMFSNVIQKARRSVEMHTMHSKLESKLTEEKTPFNEIKGTCSNMVTSPRNDNVTSILERMQHKSLKNERSYTFKSKQTAVLKHLEYAIEFLEYGNEKVIRAFDLYHKTLSELNVFKEGMKCIENAVHKVQQSELLGELSGKVNDDDFDTMINLSEDIFDNGRVILLNSQEVLKSFDHVVENNFKNFIKVSSAVSSLCSVSIENLLDNYPDLVHAIIKKVDDEIDKADRAEYKVNICYESLLPKLSELNSMGAKFFSLVHQLVDLMFRNGL